MEHYTPASAGIAFLFFLITGGVLVAAAYLLLFAGRLGPWGRPLSFGDDGWLPRFGRDGGGGDGGGDGGGGGGGEGVDSLYVPPDMIGGGGGAGGGGGGSDGDGGGFGWRGGGGGGDGGRYSDKTLYTELKDVFDGMVGSAQSAAGTNG